MEILFFLDLSQVFSHPEKMVFFEPSKNLSSRVRKKTCWTFGEIFIFKCCWQIFSVAGRKFPFSRPEKFLWNHGILAAGKAKAKAGTPVQALSDDAMNMDFFGSFDDVPAPTKNKSLVPVASHLQGGMFQFGFKHAVVSSTVGLPPKKKTPPSF